jgi:hypothetical protein
MPPELIPDLKRVQEVCEHDVTFDMIIVAFTDSYFGVGFDRRRSHCVLADQITYSCSHIQLRQHRLV